MAGDDIREVLQHRRHGEVRPVDAAHVERGYRAKRDAVDDAEQAEVQTSGIHRLGADLGFGVRAHDPVGVDDVQRFDQVRQGGVVPAGAMATRGDEPAVGHTFEHGVGRQRDALTGHLRDSVRSVGPALHRDERPGGIGVVDADGAHTAVVYEELVGRDERAEGMTAARYTDTLVPRFAPGE